MHTGKVIAVCLSEERGTVKRNVSVGYLKEGHGIVGDAHAGSDKQVSLLALEDVQKACAENGIEARPGDFAENLTTEGVDTASVPIGTHISIGKDVILEITQIGKECHLGCAIYRQIGKCIMPKEGVCAKVNRGGLVKAGDPIRVLDRQKQQAHMH